MKILILRYINCIFNFQLIQKDRDLAGEENAQKTKRVALRNAEHTSQGLEEDENSDVSIESTD